jgi:hypothetical protein
MTVDGVAAKAAEVTRIVARAGTRWRVLPLRVDAEGARLVSS